MTKQDSGKTIEELRKARKILDETLLAQINRTIEAFQNDTGVSVESVVFVKDYRTGKTHLLRGGSKLELEI